MEEWDLPRVAAWTAYCDECPPLRAMVQAYLDIKPAAKAPTTGGDAEELLNMLQVFPGAVPLSKPAPTPTEAPWVTATST